MIETPAALQYEVRRLRDIVERQYLELAWQQSELRSRGGKAKIVKFGADDLARTNLTGNAGLLLDVVPLPLQEIWPTVKNPANPLIPNCGFATYATGRDRVDVTAIAVCGLDEEKVEHVAAMVEERLRRVRNFRPLFFIDTTRTEIFRRRGFAYEYFAPCLDHEKRHAARLAAFNAGRVEFLKRKWNISGIINFGTRPVELTDHKRNQQAKLQSRQTINSAIDRVVNVSQERAGIWQTAG